MKTSKKSLILIAIFALLFSVNSFSQSITHHITLNVNTAKIDSHNASDVSNFGQEDGSSNEDFTITVGVGDIIIWEGISSTFPDDDTVNITSINYKGQKNIFGENHLKGDRQEPTKVRGTVVTGDVGDVVKYTISFKVLNNGVKRGGTYHIDPKILIKE